MQNFSFWKGQEVAVGIFRLSFKAPTTGRQGTFPIGGLRHEGCT